MAVPQIPYDGQATVTSGSGTWQPKGTLDNLVIQSTTYSSDMGKPQCEVVLKGPYQDMIKIAAKLNLSSCNWSMFKTFASNSGCPIDTSLDPLEPSSQLSTDYPVINYRLEQGQDGAGVHGKLTLTLGAYDTSGGGGGDQPLPNSEVWSLNWQPESWDVYRYCANQMLSTYIAGTGPWPITDTADAIHIQQYLSQSQDTAGKQLDWQYTSTVPGQLYELNAAERLIAKKKMAGLQPIFHYPIVTKSITKIASGLPSVSDCGSGLDTILTAIAGCPFTFAEAPDGTDWKFIMTGDVINMSRDKNTGATTYTQTWTWTGACQPDENFYGSTPFDHNQPETCRWKWGAM